MAETKTITRSLGASLAITSVSELVQLADILFKGGANQIEGVGRPEHVAHIILAGAEVGLSPTQALSTIMLVNGKTSVYGDGAMALVLASGLADEIREWSEGEGDALTYHCRVKRKGEAEPIVRSFSVADARKAELWGNPKKKNWNLYPKRMMQMRPRGYAFRDKFADVLKGLMIWEEIADSDGIVNTTATPTAGTGTGGPPAALQLPAAGATDAVTSDARPATAPTTGDASAGSAAGPVTDDQKEKFVELRKLVLASKGAADKEAQRLAWLEALEPYGVTSVAQMDSALAARAIHELEKLHDPFAGGPTRSSAA